VDNAFPIEHLKNTLLRKTCWYTLAGEGSGSIFQLYLGAKIPRQVPKRNEMLRDEARWNDAEYSLMVWCAWRLDGANEPMTSWLEPNDNSGPMVLGLAQLEGESVVDVRLCPPAWDLEIEFSGQKTLRVFCDAIKGNERTENWSVLGPDGFCLAVGESGEWVDKDDPSA
jgi:hypothetical protein